MAKRLFPSFAILVMTSVALPALQADVTTRYKTETTINPALTAIMAGAMKGADLAAPQETSLRLKNGKAFSSSMGFSSIIDFPAKKMTILDPATMRYAKMTSAQFVDETARAIPEMPASALAAMEAMKTSVSAPRLTGRTAVIQNVEVEEREIVVSTEGPEVPNTPTVPSVRMVLQLWNAKTSEVLRVPAIRELTGYSIYAYATTNPIASMDKIFKQLPGFGNAFEPMMKEMQNATPLLRMHIDVFMPGIAAMLQKMAPGGNVGIAGLNDNEPFAQMNQEMMELSTSPVSDSVFQVPENYTEASPSELLQALLAKGKVGLQ